MGRGRAPLSKAVGQRVSFGFSAGVSLRISIVITRLADPAYHFSRRKHRAEQTDSSATAGYH